MYKGLPHLHRPKKEPVPLRLPVRRGICSLGGMWEAWHAIGTRGKCGASRDRRRFSHPDCHWLCESDIIWLRVIWFSTSTFKEFPAYGSLYLNNSEVLAPPSWHIHPLDKLQLRQRFRRSQSMTSRNGLRTCQGMAHRMTLFTQSMGKVHADLCTFNLPRHCVHTICIPGQYAALFLWEYVMCVCVYMPTDDMNVCSRSSKHVWAHTAKTFRFSWLWVYCIFTSVKSPSIAFSAVITLYNQRIRMVHIGTAVFSVHFVHSVLELDGITFQRTRAGRLEGSGTAGNKNWQHLRVNCIKSSWWRDAKGQTSSEWKHAK